MKYNFTSHKYWLIAGVAIICLIIIFYPFSSFEGLDMKITRPQAIQIAKEFLQKQNINLNNFYEEGFLNNSPVEIRYLIKKLGTKEFKEYQKNIKWGYFGWRIMFHQNLPKQIAQTIYYVDISNDGNILGFKKEIPDTTYLPSLSKSDATKLIINYLHEKIGNEIEQFNLVETHEENYKTRTDYSFRWEKDEPRLNAKFVITAKVQGNTVGSYNYLFEVPQAEREYFVAAEALYGTVSIIFVIFLMMLAFYFFLKKYHQGEVWILVGRTIFIIYFTISLIEIINEWPGIGMGVMIGNLSFLYTKIIVVLINGFVIMFFLALLVFASWAVGESYARSLWPKKLIGVDAFTKGHLWSIDSGTSLMRGFVLGSGLALCYLLTDIILNKPNSTLFSSPANLLNIYIGFLPALTIVSEATTFAILASISIIFFTVNISYNKWKKKRISILLTGLVTMVGYVIAATPPSLNHFAANLLLSYLFGCSLAYLYFHFDLLTITSLFFHSILILEGYILFASSNSFFKLNSILLMIVFFVSPAIYLISRIKKEIFILENYGLPEHVKRISERERLKKEMEIAERVQLSLLPKEEPKIPGYEIASISIPAVEAGGDYYDFIPLKDNKIGIAIGDVSGKGVGAAIYMTLTKGILQAHAEENTSPKNVLEKVNRLLYKTIEKNTFVSMFYAILDYKNHTIHYARAGHNPAILCSQIGKNTKLLLSKGMALGLENGSIFMSNLDEEQIEVQKGDVFTLYTDGFTEAMNDKQQFYSEERLVKLIENNKELPAYELLDLILNDVNKFADNHPQHDDMTMLIIKRT